MDFSSLHSVWFFLSSLFSFSFCSLWCTMHGIVHVLLHVHVHVCTESMSMSMYTCTCMYMGICTCVQCTMCMYMYMYMYMHARECKVQREGVCSTEGAQRHSLHLKDDLVVVLCGLKLAECLMQSSHVVCGGHRQTIVVGFILYGFLLASLQSLVIE